MIWYSNNGRGGDGNDQRGDDDDDDDVTMDNPLQMLKFFHYIQQHHIH